MLKLILFLFIIVCTAYGLNITNDDPYGLEGIEIVQPKLKKLNETFLETKQIKKLRLLKNQNESTSFSEILNEKGKKILAKNERKYNQSYFYFKCKEYLRNYPLIHDKTETTTTSDDSNDKLFKKSNKNRNVKLILENNKNQKKIPFFVLSVLKDIENEINHNSLNYNNLNISIKNGLFSFQNQDYKFSFGKTFKKTKEKSP